MFVAIAQKWECHIEMPENDKDTVCELMFGVATKKDRKFYDALAEQEEGMSRGRRHQREPAPPTIRVV